MNRRIPIFSTLIVIAAVAVMVRLGFWQLDRLQEKTALITRYEGAASNPALVRTWELEQDFTPYLYRRTSYHCAKVAGWSAIAGTNDRGQPGIAHIASCFVYDGPVPLEDRLQTTDVVVGWSQSPAQHFGLAGMYLASSLRQESADTRSSSILR